MTEVLEVLRNLLLKMGSCISHMLKHLLDATLIIIQEVCTVPLKEKVILVIIYKICNAFCVSYAH